MGSSVPTASVYFEVQVPKLAPEFLRKSLLTSMLPEIDAIAPDHLRRQWIGQPFTKSPSPQNVLDHLNACLQATNKPLLASPTVATDTYCLTTEGVRCYFFFNVELGSEPITLQIFEDGLQLICPLMAVVRYDPTGTPAAYVERTELEAPSEESAAAS